MAVLTPHSTWQAPARAGCPGAACLCASRLRALRRRGLPAVLVTFLCCLTGCAHHVNHSSVSSIGGDAEGARLDAAPLPERVAALTGEIRRLSPTIDPREAADLADHAIRYSLLLRDTYRIERPVEWNNVLINLGLKPRGLCFQLADDLCAELRDQHYRTLEFRRGIAWRGDLWNEHNCVVVTAPGQDFYDGLVLDAWRNAGILRWAPVKKDHYPWVPRDAATDPESPTKSLQSAALSAKQ